jgi:hypothetical protein
MENTGRLAGFFLAHAVLSISEGGILIPIFGFEPSEGKRGMKRIAFEPIEQGVAQGQTWLRDNPDAAARAVLIFDGYMNLQSGRTDALIVEARRYFPQAGSIQVGVPYRSAGAPRGFAVHRPKFLKWESPETTSLPVIAEAFFQGIEAHRDGNALWQRAFDQSI